MENWYRKPHRWQLELHLSLCSHIRLPVLATSVTCHPVTVTRSGAEQAVINIDLEFYRRLSLHFKVSFFFSLSCSSFIPLFLHPHTWEQTHMYTQKMLLPLSSRCSWWQLGPEQAAWQFSLSGKSGYFSVIFFVVAISPLCESSEEVHSLQWEYITMH